MVRLSIGKKQLFFSRKKHKSDRGGYPYPPKTWFYYYAWLKDYYKIVIR